MDINHIKINLGRRGYGITIGQGMLGKFDFRAFKASKYIIVTDSNVRKLYGTKLNAALKRQGLSVELLSFRAGEDSKNIKTLERFAIDLARSLTDRNALIIALGGGVVGDLAGFLASTYKRGIRFVQVPTTLLAQIDSSIGGKTGINIPEGKNLLGTIFQPIAVIIDTETLHTLPELEIKHGLAEAIKYGMIQDETLFSFLEDNIQKRDSNFYLEIIRQSVLIKAHVVEKDETENEFRKILNYGHTVGHAVETLTNYRVTHGEAVACGMMAEGRISCALGFLNKQSLERQNNLIAHLGFSMKFNYEPKKLIDIMKRDKKSKKGELFFILPERIGAVYSKNGRVAIPVSDTLVLGCLREK